MEYEKEERFVNESGDVISIRFNGESRAVYQFLKEYVTFRLEEYGRSARIALMESLHKASEDVWRPKDGMEQENPKQDNEAT